MLFLSVSLSWLLSSFRKVRCLLQLCIPATSTVLSHGRLRQYLEGLRAMSNEGSHKYPLYSWLSSCSGPEFRGCVKRKRVLHMHLHICMLRPSSGNCLIPHCRQHEPVYSRAPTIPLTADGSGTEVRSQDKAIHKEHKPPTILGRSSKAPPSFFLHPQSHFSSFFMSLPH